MKTLNKSTLPNKSSYHERCVCQICTCHKHHCPHSTLNLPTSEISTNQHDFVPHELNPWQKQPPEKAKPYQPYGYINSTQREDFPGHKPTLRQKIVPRVKNQDKNVPFTGTSEYKNSFPLKIGQKEPLRNKDKEYNPDKSPFQGTSTYKSSYDPKEIKLHQKKKPEKVQFPPGYGFQGGTTYKKDFQGKYIDPPKNCKPPQKISSKGPHDLMTINRQDYGPKEMPQPCPILKLPHYGNTIHYPNQHFYYDKTQNQWFQK